MNINISTIIVIIAAVNIAAAIYIVWALGRRPKNANGPQIILDTCALIDGRVVEIAKSGFISQTIIIPQFVIAELQYLADHGDSHKRERSRFGLDVVRELQALDMVGVEISRENFDDIKEVDDKLVKLAKLKKAMLYTTDYNLNKVAKIEGVVVLNVNELSHALRPLYLPGEQIEIKITQVGQDPSQGVGYLEDGTMVVVEQAARRLGQKVLVECSRILQTQAGKMMFAVVVNKKSDNQAKSQPKQQIVAMAQQNQPKPTQLNQPNQNRPPKKQDFDKSRQQAQQQKPRQQPQSPEDALLEAINKQRGH